MLITTILVSNVSFGVLTRPSHSLIKRVIYRSSAYYFRRPLRPYEGPTQLPHAKLRFDDFASWDFDRPCEPVDDGGVGACTTGHLDNS